MSIIGATGASWLEAAPTRLATSALLPLFGSLEVALTAGPKLPVSVWLSKAVASGSLSRMRPDVSLTILLQRAVPFDQ